MAARKTGDFGSGLVTLGIQFQPGFGSTDGRQALDRAPFFNHNVTRPPP